MATRNKTTLDRLLDYFRNNKWFSGLLFLGIVIIGLGTLTDSLSKIGEFVKSLKTSQSEGKSNISIENVNPNDTVENRIDELLKAWMTSCGPIDTNLIFNKGKEMFQQARKEKNPSAYVLSAQLLMTTDDFVSAKAILDEAASLFPAIDGPHFELSDLYYRLAFFDIIRRGKYEIRREPTGDIPITELVDGYLRIDMQELAGPGGPSIYRDALRKLGIVDFEVMAILIYLFSIDPSGLQPEVKEFLPQMIEKVGRPTYLPIVTWKPDNLTKQLLMLSQSEMRAALSGYLMKEPEGLMIIDKRRANKLAIRIDDLLQKDDEIIRK